MAVVERSQRCAGGCPISRAGSVNLNARASGCQPMSVGLTGAILHDRRLSLRLAVTSPNRAFETVPNSAALSASFDALDCDVKAGSVNLSFEGVLRLNKWEKMSLSLRPSQSELLSVGFNQDSGAFALAPAPTRRPGGAPCRPCESASRGRIQRFIFARFLSPARPIRCTSPPCNSHLTPARSPMRPPACRLLRRRHRPGLPHLQLRAVQGDVQARLL